MGVSVDNIISVASGIGGVLIGYAGLRQQQRQAEIERLTANERRLTRIEAELEDLKDSVDRGSGGNLDVEVRLKRLEKSEISIKQTVDNVFALLSGADPRTD